MKTKWFLYLWVFLPLAAFGQIRYSGGVYGQDFNTLESGVVYRNYTTLPAGWMVSKGWYVWTPVTNGYSNNYGTYCFSSSAGDPDKAIGLVIGSTGPGYLGAQLRNETGVTLTGFGLSYHAEQWAKGEVVAEDQEIPFEYSLNATALTVGTFREVAGLGMHSTQDGDGVLSALDGNADANRTRVTGSVQGITWLPGRDLWIRWRGVPYDFFSAHALAVDEVAFWAPPRLRIWASGPQHYRIGWPTNYAGCVLQGTGSLTGGGWSTISQAPVTIGTESTVEVDAVGSAQYFRLIKP